MSESSSSLVSESSSTVRYSVELLLSDSGGAEGLNFSLSVSLVNSESVDLRGVELGVEELGAALVAELVPIALPTLPALLPKVGAEPVRTGGVPEMETLCPEVPRREVDGAAEADSAAEVELVPEVDGGTVGDAPEEVVAPVAQSLSLSMSLAQDKLGSRG